MTMQHSTAEKRKRAERLVENLPDMLTASEVMEFFRVSRTTVGEWLKNGSLPGSMKIGRDWRIPKTDIIDLAIKMYGNTEETGEED
ncbi:HTH DNA binding protein [Gordonia phage Gmala1]|uniref:DNA binding protein n=1 Tax=Gordonia phage Gmala1 TaxID=1622190 RepID=A0A0E3XBF8_9CAUD|nr:HTH DNA binding protein [Gordonia phage Gmala1]AKC02892.1 DNA binding protein [Gordonia phage Gmala1]